MDEIKNTNIKLKANVYFDGGVISHTIFLADGSRKSVGIIRPGEYHFDTGAAERMDIIAGECKVRQKGETAWMDYKAGQFFNVPAKSAFDIKVASGLAEYLCSFE